MQDLLKQFYYSGVDGKGTRRSREPISAIAEIPSVCLLVEHEHRAGRDRKAPALPHTEIGEAAPATLLFLL